MVRTHKGTEIIWVSIIKRLLRHNNGDELAGDNSIVQGESSANQRIEAYWSKLKQGGGSLWMKLFKGLIVDVNQEDVEAC